MFKRTLAIWGLAFLLALPGAQAEPQCTNAQKTPDRTYKLLREDEDWSFLRDRSLRQDFWDPIKYIPLRGNAKDWYMTIGGEVRYVWEQVGNDNWGQQPFTNGYFNERYMPYVDLHFGSHFRAFFEPKSGVNSYRIPGPRPIDEKKLDFQAGFLELSSTSCNWTKLQAGRLELEYGDGRLIDVREGPNVRLSFDGFRVMRKINAWEIDGFAVRPDEDNFGFFDNEPNNEIAFWGVYATRSLPRNTSLDVYYLGESRKNAMYERGTAEEVRHSVGGRLSRPPATKQDGWDFDDEALWQFGTFGSAGIRAWSVASETGYRWVTRPLKPHFTMKADISTGDHPLTNTLGTFYPYFPKGQYFGVLATVGPGPLNFIDVHPDIEGTFPHNVFASFGWLFYWRQSLEDGVYSVPGFLIRAADGSRARFVGHRPGTEVRWSMSRHAWLQVDYGIFYAGPFLKQTKPGQNLNYLALWAGYEF